MKAVPKFLTLTYMHRDGGNYKTFGTVTLQNDLQMQMEKIDLMLREKLIDAAYFYPSKWGIPNLSPEEAFMEGFEEWNEYLGLEECLEMVPVKVITITLLI